MKLWIFAVLLLAAFVAPSFQEEETQVEDTPKAEGKEAFILISVVARMITVARNKVNIYSFRSNQSEQFNEQGVQNFTAGSLDRDCENIPEFLCMI